MRCEYVGDTDIVERFCLFPPVVHLVAQDLPVFLSEVVQPVVRCEQRVCLMRKSGFVERTLRVLCDKSTLLQIGENVCQSALLRKDLDVGHELVARNTPQRVSQLSLCIAMWKQGRRTTKRKTRL
jgi:hypothetical protein